jgi:hypothetical protein
MADHDRPSDPTIALVLGDLSERLDTVAGAVASLVAAHSALGAQLLEAETSRAKDASDLVRRLDGLEQALLALPDPPMAVAGGHEGSTAPSVDVDDLRADVALSLEVLVRVAEIVERLEDRTEPADELSTRLTSHTDVALAGAVRLIDGRLAVLREELRAGSGSPSAAQPAGFEAGAVMGASQAAWNRLEQRLDTEFDELSRQLSAMAELLEATATSAEAAANRPVLAGDQLRKAAASMKSTVIGAGRSAWERRADQRGLGRGT